MNNFENEPQVPHGFTARIPPKPKRDVLFCMVDASCFESSSGITEDVEIGIMSITCNEQIECAKMAEQGNNTSLTIELTKFCLRFWRPASLPQRIKINHANMEQETYWSLLGARGQDVATAAFVRQNRAIDTDSGPKPVAKMRSTFQTEALDV